jgi:GMP synthase-like glutamine amidotransferase
MKAALLICDHTDPKARKIFGDYPDMFMNLFPEFDWHSYDCINGEFPEELKEDTIYFVPGSRHSAYEDLPWINQLKDIIRTIYSRQNFLIGVCFGHQLIAEALGGKVERSPRGWCVGVHEFGVRETMTWMVPQREKINLLMMCQDQVSVLPKGAKVLAGNTKCPVGMYQIDDCVLTVQAHPEFPIAYNRMLMEDRTLRIGEKTAKEGLESLDLPVDKEVFRAWVLQFILKN